MLAFLKQIHLDLPSNDRERWIENIRGHVAANPDRSVWVGAKATVESQLVSGAYLTIYPGKLGVLTGPLDVDPSVASIGSLQREMIQTLFRTAAKSGVEMVQAVLDGETLSRGRIYSEAGMVRAAKLLQLQAWVSRLNASHYEKCNSSELHWTPFDPCQTSTWQAMLDATYEQTLDCPELNGIRKTEDTWAGYVASANDDLSEWWTLSKDGTDMGCLMLNKQTKNFWELIYMGILPAFRGRGLGRQLIDFAFERARRNGVEILGLSADERNHPALDLYREFGFHVERSMEAWFWSPNFHLQNSN